MCTHIDDVLLEDGVGALLVVGDLKAYSGTAIDRGRLDNLQ